MQMARSALLRDSFRDEYNKKWKSKKLHEKASTDDLTLEIKCLKIENEKLNTELTNSRAEIDRLTSSSEISKLENQLREKNYEITKLKFENRNLKLARKRRNKMGEISQSSVNNNVASDAMPNSISQPILVFELKNIEVSMPTIDKVLKIKFS